MTPRRQPLGTALALLRLVPAYLTFAVLKHVLALPRLARFAWRQPGEKANEDRRRRAVARVIRMRQLVPIADGDCLQKSLLLYRELSYEGADPVLVVGFRTTGRAVQGHAWVEVEGAAVADDGHDGEPFVPAVRFGREGRIVAGHGRQNARAGLATAGARTRGSARGVLFAAVLVSFVFVVARSALLGGPPVVMSYLSMFSCFGYAGMIGPLFYQGSPRARAVLLAATGAVAMIAAAGLAAAELAAPVNLAKALLVSAGAVGVGVYLRAVMHAPAGDERRAALSAARDAAILPVAIVQVTFFLWPQIAINPVYDAHILAFERLIGFDMERSVVASYRWIHPVSALATGAYLALPVGLSMVALTQPSSEGKTRVLLALLATGAVGFLLYYICPAVGPTQAFSTLYPDPLPRLSPHEIAPIWTPGRVPRNGMPSLHGVWIVLILLNMRHLGRAWRTALLTFGVLNVWSAVGRYEHWLLDLVISVPMAAALQLMFEGGGRRSPVLRWVFASTCGALTVGWLVGLRTGALVHLPAWAAWAGIILTLATIGLLASRAVAPVPRRQQDRAPAAG